MAHEPCTGYSTLNLFCIIRGYINSWSHLFWTDTGKQKVSGFSRSPRRIKWSQEGINVLCQVHTSRGSSRDLPAGIIKWVESVISISHTNVKSVYQGCHKSNHPQSESPQLVKAQVGLNGTINRRTSKENKVRVKESLESIHTVIFWENKRTNLIFGGWSGGYGHHL